MRPIHKAGLSAKTATRVNTSHAGGRAADSWSHRAKRRIARLKKDGFRIVAMDEVFFVHNDAAGRKCWFLVGILIKTPHAGDGG